MKIEHVAIWVKDLDKMKAFYEKYFHARANQKYHNVRKNFQSYFLTFESGCRLELMHKPEIDERENDYATQQHGLIHLAISVGNQQKVDELTTTLANEGFKVVGQPRTTGDGYYESVILDPENNIIEITV